ncbi:putative methyltransferase DDB_G0268948 isoform X2 [Brienomyrus brachyistius]|nr:putative methyltransferase DDB_G0268948 isoform X2 [Brienomyrus brachyistius]
MAHRLFEGKEHAVSYQKYRLSPSEQLIGEILTFLEKKKVRPFGLAADVGCGSGQGTIRLGPHFLQVVGMDVSPAQLEMARACASAPNISYRQCPAEELPLEDGSVDLVTAMSAAHWFDRPRFLAEAFRVLRPGGCLALLNYTLDMELEYRDCSQELNHICRELYSAIWPYRSTILGPDSTILYKEMFDSIPYPEKEWHDCISVKHSIPVSSYIGMVESFSNYQTLLEKKPEEARKLSQDVRDRLLAVMKVSSPETEVGLVVKYYCLLARKPDVS